MRGPMTAVTHSQWCGETPTPSSCPTRRSSLGRDPNPNPSHNLEAVHADRARPRARREDRGARGLVGGLDRYYYRVWFRDDQIRMCHTVISTDLVGLDRYYRVV